MAARARLMSKPCLGLFGVERQNCRFVSASVRRSSVDQSLKESLSATFHMMESSCVNGPWAWTAGYEHLVVNAGGTTFTQIRLVVDLTVCALILFGNAFIICALLYQRWCRKETLCPRFRVSSLFVISLVVADLLGGCSLLFHLVTQNLCVFAEILTQQRSFCLMRTIGLVFSASISISSLAVISVDRYVAILHSLRYPELMTRRRAGLMICAAWIFASFGAFSLFFWNDWRPGRPCHEADNIPLQYALLIGLPMCLGVTFLLVVTHICIRREVRRMQIRRMTAPGNIFGVQIEKNSEKSVRAVILVIGCFLLCWLPISTFLLLRLFGYKTPAMEIGLQVSYSLANFNAVLNPFVYSWKNASLRTALIQFCTKLIHPFRTPPTDRTKTTPQPPIRSILSAQQSTVSAASTTSTNSTSTTLSFDTPSITAPTSKDTPGSISQRGNHYKAFPSVM